MNDRRQGNSPLRGKPIDDNGAIVFDKPVPSGTQDEREREIPKCHVGPYYKNEVIFADGIIAVVGRSVVPADCKRASDIVQALSLLDAERKRAGAVAILLRAKCSDAEWEAMPKELRDVAESLTAPLREQLERLKQDKEFYTSTKAQWKERAEAAEREIVQLKKQIEELCGYK